MTSPSAREANRWFLVRFSLGRMVCNTESPPVIDFPLDDLVLRLPDLGHGFQHILESGSIVLPDVPSGLQTPILRVGHAVPNLETTANSNPTTTITSPNFDEASLRRFEVRASLPNLMVLE